MLFGMCFGGSIGGWAFFIVVLINIFLGGFCIQYDIQHLSAFFGHACYIEYWKCCIAGLFLGDIAITVACVIWLLSNLIS